MSGAPDGRSDPRKYYRLLAGLLVLSLATLWLPETLTVISPTYAPFLHTLMEMAAMVVAVLVFGVTWDGDAPRRPVAMLWLACALFAAAWLDFAHVMSYPGMPEFITPANPEKAILFWLAGRLLVAGTFLAATFMAGTTDSRLSRRLLAGYLVVVVAIYWLVLFHQEALPRVLSPGRELTAFGIGLECLVIGLAAGAAWRCRVAADGLPFDAAVLFAAAVVTLLSELCFGLSQFATDAANQLSHVLKVVAYALLYRALFMADIRATKARNEELAVARARFADLVESVPDFIWEVDPAGVYTYVSPQVWHTLGYNPEELLGRTPFDFMPPEEGRRVRQIFEAMVALRVPFQALENVNLRKDGGEVVLETSGVPVFDEAGGLAGYRGSDRDITARILSEAALASERTRLRTLIDTLPDMVWLKDPDGVYLACNPVFERLVGAKGAEVVGKTDHDLFDRELADSFRLNDRQAVAGDGPLVIEEWVTFAGQTERTLLQTIKTPMHDVDGKLLGVLGIARDITALRAAEAALRESEANLNRAQAVAHIGSWNLDVRDNVLTWSPENYRIFGVVPGTPQTYDTFLDRVHPDDRDTVQRQWQAALRGRPYDIEHRLLVDGEVRWVREKADLRFAADGELIGGTGITQDITERKLAELERELLERQLHQAQKMEAMGQLTGGIAHDFNNILASILGYARLAQMRLAEDPDDKLADYLRNVVTSGERARDLIAKLLAYSRVKVDKEVGDLMPVPAIREAVGMLGSTIPDGIELAVDLDEATPAIRIDPVELQQVLVNLVLNARDAIGGQGQIVIALHRAADIAGLCALCKARVAGEYVVLAVSDSGTGIDPGKLDRIFDPFFTTKEVGKGSGLGLSMVQGIVKAAGGHILIDSRPGEGSVFRVLLPVAGSRVDDDKV